MEPHKYNVDLRWINDRIGEVSSPELMDSIDVATPPQFPKGVEGVWSPEHFFTAALSSCFMTTFLAIAENSGLDFISFQCRAEGVLDKVEGKYQMTEVILYPILKIRNEADREKALRILEKSDKACLISNSVKSQVSLQAEVTV